MPGVKSVDWLTVRTSSTGLHESAMALRVLAVLTALLFLFAFVQGCSAAAGDDGSESAYISFLISK